MQFSCLIWVFSRNDFGFAECQFEMLIVVHFCANYSENNNKLQKYFILKSEYPVNFSA